jgi:hypothetical protein
MGLRPIRPAQARGKTPVAGKIPEPRGPDDLAPLVGPQPHRLHAVVENLFRHPIQLPEGLFMQAQQRPQLLVHRRLGDHDAAIAEGESEPPELPLLALPPDRPQMPPVHLRLLPRWRLEPPHRHHLRRRALRPQPVREQRVAPRVVPRAQLPQQHPRVPDPGPQPLFPI